MENDTKNRTKSANPFQLSIREFLFLVVAVASLIVLYANHRSFRPTPFADNFAPSSIIQAALDKLNVTSQGGFGGGGSSGSRRVSLSYRASYEKISGTTQSAVLLEIFNVVKKQLEESGCELTGGHIDSTNDSDMHECVLVYKNQSAFGQIRIRSSIGIRNDWQFWFDIFEY